MQDLENNCRHYNTNTEPLYLLLHVSWFSKFTNSFHLLYVLTLHLMVTGQQTLDTSLTCHMAL